MKRSQLKMSSSASSARSQRLKHVYFLASAFNNHGISPTTMHFSIICRKWEQMKIYWQKLWNTWLNRGFFYAPSPKKVFFKMSVYSGCLLAVMDKVSHWLHYLSIYFLMLKMQLHLIIFSLWLALIERFRETTTTTKQLAEVVSHPTFKEIIYKYALLA